MTNDSTGQRFDRVTIDDRGVSQRPILFFFGGPFTLAWSEITAWAVTDQLIRDVKTGAERIDRHVLEFHSDGKVNYIIRPARDPAFQGIVDPLRRRLPDKDTQSLLAEMSALRAKVLTTRPRRRRGYRAGRAAGSTPCNFPAPFRWIVR